MPHASLSFREATPEDAVAIAALVKSAYRGDSSRQGWTTEADLLQDERIDAAGVLAKLAAPQGLIILGHDDEGRLASCCELERKNEELGYFGMFAVDPRRQSGGIGRQTMDEAERIARGRWGLKRLEMTVIWLRDDLIAWYLRRGYRKMEETRPFPYEQLGEKMALRDDLHFSVLVKDL